MYYAGFNVRKGCCVRVEAEGFTGPGERSWEVDQDIRLGISKGRCCAHSPAKESNPGFLSEQLSSLCHAAPSPAPELGVGVSSQSNLCTNCSLTDEVASHEKHCQGATRWLS